MPTSRRLETKTPASFPPAAAFHNFLSNIQSHLGQIARPPAPPPVSISVNSFLSLFRGPCLSTRANLSHLVTSSRGQRAHPCRAHPSRTLSSNRGFSLRRAPYWCFGDPMAQTTYQPTALPSIEKNRENHRNLDAPAACEGCGIERPQHGVSIIDAVRHSSFAPSLAAHHREKAF